MQTLEDGGNIFILNSTDFQRIARHRIAEHKRLYNHRYENLNLAIF
jgi:hypothetical protein